MWEKFLFYAFLSDFEPFSDRFCGNKKLLRNIWPTNHQNLDETLSPIEARNVSYYKKACIWNKKSRKGSEGKGGRTPRNKLKENDSFFNSIGGTWWWGNERMFMFLLVVIIGRKNDAIYYFDLMTKQNWCQKLPIMSISPYLNTRTEATGILDPKKA